MRALVVSSVVMVCLSQTLLGYDIGIMSGAMIFVRKYFDLSDQQTELAVGVTNLVATIGAFLAGSFADSLGRRLVIFISNAAFLLGAAFTAGAWNFESFVVGRVVMGLGVGGGLTIPAVYVAEISPTESRGLLSSATEVFIAVGVLLGYMAAFFLEPLPESYNWREMLGLGCFPPIVVMIGIFFFPESPRWLVMQGRPEAAREVLQRICESEEEVSAVLEILMLTEGGKATAATTEENERQGYGSTDTRALPLSEAEVKPSIEEGGDSGKVTERGEYASSHKEEGKGKEKGSRRTSVTPYLSGNARAFIKRRSQSDAAVDVPLLQEHTEAPGDRKGSQWRELLMNKDPMTRRRIAAALMVPALSQSTGIEAATAFSATILQQAGYTSHAEAFRAAIFMGVCKVLAVVVAAFYVDSVGRVPLLALSFVVMSGALFAFAGFTAGAYPPLCLLGAFTTFIMGHSIGAGPVAFIMPAELLPLSVRGLGKGLAMFMQRLVSALTSMTYLSATAAMGTLGMNVFYGSLGVFSLVYTLLAVPETAKKSLEAIEREKEDVEGIGNVKGM